MSQAIRLLVCHSLLAFPALTEEDTEEQEFSLSIE